MLSLPDLIHFAWHINFSSFQTKCARLPKPGLSSYLMAAIFNVTIMSTASEHGHNNKHRYSGDIDYAAPLLTGAPPFTSKANGIHWRVMKRMSCADLISLPQCHSSPNKKKKRNFSIYLRGVCVRLNPHFVSPPLLSHWQCLSSSFNLSASFRLLMQWRRQLWGLREACPHPAGAVSHPSFMPPCLPLTSFAPLRWTMRQE